VETKNKTRPLKKAICTMKVPSVLSPTGADIEVGTEIEYSKVRFRNGENYLELPDKQDVPAVFFDF